MAGDARIEWLGRISDDEKASRLRAADVFCAPSLRGESFGVVLLEAMAASTPVVASDLPGYSNVARSGRDALLVPPGDTRALADALRRVLTDPTCAAELVASGEQRAGHFSMEQLAEATSRSTSRSPRARAGGNPHRRHPLGGAGPMMTPMIIAIVLIVILVLLIGFLVITYNGLVSLRNRIDAAWAQIDVQLKRRYDLIPNLVETVKGYAAHEQRDLREGHPGPQHGHQRPGTGRGRPGRQRAVAVPSSRCSPCPRPTPTSRPTRTSSTCRRS